MKSPKPHSILVVGSLAFDIIFDLHGRIQHQIQIKNGKLGKQNLMFTAKNKKQFFGGTGGNIAYGLGLLNTNPVLFSVAGKDFLGEYDTRLGRLGVKSRVWIDKKGYTATWYGMTDAAREQVGVWQGNAYSTHIDSVSLKNTISSQELKNITLAIFAAGTPKSTLKLMKELRQANREAKIIFDPGQSLSLYDKKTFAVCLSISNFFIANDIEIAYSEKLLGLNLTKALEEGKIVVETKGKEGSVIHQKDSKTYVPAEKPKKVVDVSGAGDAYRAGFIFGLLKEKSLFEAGKMGSKIASKCVEELGAQEYTF